MLQITGIHMHYYHVCHRKLWLFAKGITMEHGSDLVYEGRWIGETSYPERSEKYTEIEIAGSKIDFYDPKRKIIHEVKKSDKMEEAHEWQVKYYIWLLKQQGIVGVEAILEYPKLRQRKQVILSPDDEQKILDDIHHIHQIMQQDSCPPRIEKKYCLNCSYFDLCYVED
jgi:CRISPR-associated exonuclease Cas4